MDGITSNTPKKILFGAGTIHKGLEYSNSWNFDTTIIGATEGGSTLTITPEYKTIEPDNATVKIEGLTVKTGEVATLQTTFLEITKDIIKASACGEVATNTDVTGYSKLTSKANVETGDYIENLAFVGETIEGKKVIVIFDNALCTSGVELSGQNKNEVTMSATFECHAKLTGDHNVLPWRVYFED